MALSIHDWQRCHGWLALVLCVATPLGARAQWRTLVDRDDVIVSLDTTHPAAVGNGGRSVRMRWVLLEDSLRPRLAVLHTVEPVLFEIESVSLDCGGVRHKVLAVSYYGRSGLLMTDSFDDGWVPDTGVAALAYSEACRGIRGSRRRHRRSARQDPSCSAVLDAAHWGFLRIGPAGPTNRR